LRARIRSTGIDEAKFAFDNIAFTMVDVGGQRSERRKWIHCFEGINAVLFTVSLSEYDQTLREDPSQNRSKESLLLFDEILNSPWFAKTAFILFLNKIDLFEQKLPLSPLNKTFPEFNGGSDVNLGKQFMRSKFEAANVQQKKIFCHYTCAVDTQNIEFVFKAIRETILTELFETMF